MIGLQTQRTYRRIIREAVDVEHPAERGQHGVVGDIVAIRAGLPERRNRAEHERWILEVENIPAKPELVERADCEALDNDVGTAGELEQDISTARMLEVKRQ